MPQRNTRSKKSQKREYPTGIQGWYQESRNGGFISLRITLDPDVLYDLIEEYERNPESKLVADPDYAPNKFCLFGTLNEGEDGTSFYGSIQTIEQREEQIAKMSRGRGGSKSRGRKSRSRYEDDYEDDYDDEDYEEPAARKRRRR